jgi:hypothetical protein
MEDAEQEGQTMTERHTGEDVAVFVNCGGSLCSSPCTKRIEDRRWCMIASDHGGILITFPLQVDQLADIVRSYQTGLRLVIGAVTHRTSGM